MRSVRLWEKYSSAMTKRSEHNAKRSPGRLAMTQRSSSAFAEVAANLADVGKSFYARGWVLGTSGNFSAVISREPLRLAITSTGLDKSKLQPADHHHLQRQCGERHPRGRPAIRRSSTTSRGSPQPKCRGSFAHPLGLEYAAFRHTRSAWRHRTGRLRNAERAGWRSNAQTSRVAADPGQFARHDRIGGARFENAAE